MAFGICLALFCGSVSTTTMHLRLFSTYRLFYGVAECSGGTGSLFSCVFDEAEGSPGVTWGRYLRGLERLSPGHSVSPCHSWVSSGYQRSSRKRAHQEESTSERDHIRERSHQEESTSGREHIRKRSHQGRITSGREYIRKRSHQE